MVTRTITYIFFLLTLASVNNFVTAQNEPVEAFHAMKIANLQSTKVADKGEWYMYVSHRFGSIKDGYRTFFGIDEAVTKIQFLYGVMDGLQVGFSREAFRKTYALSGKMSFWEQTKDMPISLAAYATVNIDTELKKSRYPNMKFADRLSYVYQLLVARRFFNKLSLELAPTFVRQNLVLEPFQQHNQTALGVGLAYHLSKHVSINIDYVHNFNRASNSIYKEPLTVGVDIKTGTHVFQLLFSNAQSTNEAGFISNAAGDWGSGDIYFGFNLVRVFGGRH